MTATETLAPTFVLYENGQKVQDRILLASIVRITVDERLDQAAVCMVELADRGLALSSGDHFAVGSELKIELGYVGATDVLFDGEVTSWRESFPRRGAPTLVLFGLDRFHRLKRERKNKTFCNMKDADIARQVLGGHQLQVDADSTDVTHDYVIQANQSDADFLLARASLNGFEVSIDGKKATFRKPKLDDAAAVTLKWHEDLTSFTAAISVASAHAKVEATAYDMKQKAPVSASVAPGGESSSMGGLKTGNQILANDLDASEPTNDPFRPLLSPEEANLLAQATMDRDSKKFVTGEGRVPGNTKVRRGVVVAIDGIGEHLSGSYYCSAAIHTLIPRFGYATVFRVYRTSVLSPKQAPPVQGEPGQPPGQPTPPTGPVEFVVKNQFGEVVDGLEYVLTCPDGEKKTGTIPASGVVREENAKPGVYKLALKGVDPPRLEWDEAEDDEPPPAGGGAGSSGAIDASVLDSEGQPASGVDWKLVLADGSTKTGTTGADGKIHVETDQEGDAKLSFPGLDDPDASSGGAGGAASGDPGDAGGGSTAAATQDDGSSPPAEDSQTGDFFVSLAIDPDDAKHSGDRFELASDDGSVSISKTVQDDMIPGDDKVELQFEKLDKSKKYTLKVIESDGTTTTVFEGKSYDELAGAPDSGGSSDDAAGGSGSGAGDPGDLYQGDNEPAGTLGDKDLPEL